MTTERVLILDDEANVLQALRRSMRKLDVEITTTASPTEALEILSRESFAVVISDQNMPEMDGTTFLEHVRECAPDTVRIMLTGHADVHAALDAINRSAVYRFLTKPWSDGELHHAVLQAIDRFRLVVENKRLLALTEEQNEKLRQFNKNLMAKVYERTRQLTEANEQLTGNFKGSLDVLARLAELHSPTLRFHAKRVAGIAKAMGARLGLSDEELFQLETAATLHDIGKIGMDADLVVKASGRMNARNRAVLLTHAVTGASLVAMIPNLQDAALLVRHHHERFDGKGFPDQLDGPRIPLGARVIAVADAYDNAINGVEAIGTITREQALADIRQKSNSHLDPDMIELLARCLYEGDIQVVRDGEIEVGLNLLRPGMMLSRDVVSVGGMTLLSRGESVEDWQIRRLQRFHKFDPIMGVFVFRHRPDEIPGSEALPSGDGADDVESVLTPVDSVAKPPGDVERPAPAPSDGSNV